LLVLQVCDDLPHKLEEAAGQGNDGGCIHGSMQFDGYWGTDRSLHLSVLSANNLPTMADTKIHGLTSFPRTSFDS
ncbi:MAG: hypothetical protein ACYSWU_25110, partial [Planctomycetota bacterium]